MNSTQRRRRRRRRRTTTMFTSDAAVTVTSRHLLRRLPTLILVLSLTTIVIIILSVKGRASRDSSGKISTSLSSVLFSVSVSSSSPSSPHSTHDLATTHRNIDNVTITIIGDPINVWSSVDSLHKCQSKHNLIDVPDIPTRAWYSPSDNRVHMVQGSTNYHQMKGADILNVSRSCDVSWNKTGNSDPSMFAGNEFLDSTFAFSNNQTVVSLVHTEYPGNNYNNCIGPAYPRCWTVTLGLMVSHDDGKTWSHVRPPPHHVVAVVPYQYSPESDQKAFGWGDPTNILFYEGYWYVAAWNRNTVGLQKAGVCMMRTSSILDPSSWRGWNGSNWSVSFRSPYNNSNNNGSMTSKFDPADHICQVLDIVSKRDDPTSSSLRHIIDPTQCNPFGLVRHKTKDLFLMTWSCLNGKEFYVSTSADLIHWSFLPQSVIYDHGMLPDDVAKNVTSIHYPSLIDDTNTPIKQSSGYGDGDGGDGYDNNYYTVGDKPYLFWVSFGHNVYVDGRSVWATPISIDIDIEIEIDESKLDDRPRTLPPTHTNITLED